LDFSTVSPGITGNSFLITKSLVDLFPEIKTVSTMRFCEKTEM